MRTWVDSVALVTGASSGIGHAVARAVLERGGRVVAVALERGDLGREFEDRTHWLEIDLSRSGEIADRLAVLPEAFEAVDAVVNCAGHDVGGRVGFDQMAAADIAAIIAVNLTGAMLVTHAVLPRLIRLGRGDVVNIGSISAKEVIATIAAYAASKHGLHGFTAALRADLAGTGVRVTEIVPGKTRTQFAASRWRGDVERGKAYYDDSPRGCLSPQDVAAAVIWALDQPPGVMLSEAVILPTPDANPPQGAHPGATSSTAKHGAQS